MKFVRLTPRNNSSSNYLSLTLTGVRRAQRPHGHEHHLEGEEGNPVAGPAHQLGAGGQQPGGRQGQEDGEDQGQDAAAPGSHLTGKSERAG